MALTRVFESLDEGRQALLSRRALGSGTVPGAVKERLRSVFGRDLTPQEAVEQINKDKRAAAATYQRMTGTKEGVEEIYAMIAAPEVEMTVTPHQTLKMASFMAETGRLKKAPKDWKELFFDNVHALPGS